MRLAAAFIFAVFMTAMVVAVFGVTPRPEPIDLIAGPAR